MYMFMNTDRLFPPGYKKWENKALNGIKSVMFLQQSSVILLSYMLIDVFVLLGDSYVIFFFCHVCNFQIIKHIFNITNPEKVFYVKGKRQTNLFWELVLIKGANTFLQHSERCATEFCGFSRCESVWKVNTVEL